MMEKLNQNLNGCCVKVSSSLIQRIRKNEADDSRHMPTLTQLNIFASLPALFAQTVNVMTGSISELEKVKGKYTI